jgi:hypothetical protein
VIADGSLIPVHEQGVAYPRLALLAPLDKIPEPFRITGKGSVLLPNVATMYGLEDVRVSSPMTLARMSETFKLWSTVGPRQFHSVPDLGAPMLSLMNVRFALQDVSDPIPPGWRNVTYEGFTRLIENERVLPRAFVPRRVRIGVSRLQDIEEMAAGADFAELSWLGINDQVHERDNGTGEAAITRRGQSLTMDVTKHGDGFLVISQTAWNGWRAYLDGERVTIIRANHAFLGVYVPDGRHSLVLRYLPQSFVTGRAISLSTVVLLIAGGILVTSRQRRASIPR